MTRVGPVVPGIDRDLASKISMKSSDPEMEGLVRKWFESVLGEQLPGDSLHEVLKDGIYLCKLAKAVCPEEDLVFSTSKFPFKQMENINLFLNVAKKVGVPQQELFQTIDLYENKNMYQVMICILAFSRHAQKNGYTGPVVGPKLAEKQEIHFTEEQFLKSKTEISLQYGYTGGASQSGMCYGRARDISYNAVDPGRQNSPRKN